MTEAELDDRAREVMAILGRIKPLLAGVGSEMQGAVLAELLRMWVCGHQVPGDPEATREVQGEMLSFHFTAVGVACGLAR